MATLGLGLVLGPKPRHRLARLAIVAVRMVKKDTPDHVIAVLAASAAVAAIATIFGSPVIGAIILIEAAGLGGPMLPLVLLPGLMSAGIGSVVFIGMGHWTGLSSSAYALSPFTLPAFSTLTAADFGWAIALAFAAAAVTFAIVEGARRSAGVVARQPWMLLPAGALAVGGLAIAFAQITGQPADLVLFSGQDAFSSLVKQALSCLCPPWRSCSCSRAWPGASRWETSAAARHSRPCSSARPAGCSPRTCRDSPRRPPWPC